jgi:hypothetical protein
MELSLPPTLQPLYYGAKIVPSFAGIDSEMPVRAYEDFHVCALHYSTTKERSIDGFEHL